MKEMFVKFHENEKNENTAFVLMLGVLSEELTEIINLLSENNSKLTEIGKELQKMHSAKKELDDKKFYMPLTADDYD